MVLNHFTSSGKTLQFRSG